MNWLKTSRHTDTTSTHSLNILHYKVLGHYIARTVDQVLSGRTERPSHIAAQHFEAQ